MNPTKFKNDCYHGRSVTGGAISEEMVLPNYMALYLCIHKNFSSSEALRAMGIAECHGRETMPLADRVAEAAYILTKICGLRYIDAAGPLNVSAQTVGTAVKTFRRRREQEYERKNS